MVRLAADHRGDAEAVLAALQQPVDDKRNFAGEATSQDNWSTVHGAMQTRYDAIERILRLGD